MGFRAQGLELRVQGSELLAEATVTNGLSDSRVFMKTTKGFLMRLSGRGRCKDRTARVIEPSNL